MFPWFKKKPATEEPLADLSDWERTCPDCDAADGALHDLFCLKERCPFCGWQLAGCGCIHEVLCLNEAEREAVDEYVDDDVEPLRSIMERWKDALNLKGRIPFAASGLAVNGDSLIIAAARGELPFVRALLAKGVAVDSANEADHTPLMAAAHNFRGEVVKFLLEAGADVHRANERGQTPLHCAVSTIAPERYSCDQMQVECVRLLLKRGAMVDARDREGNTPLMSAAWFECGPSIEELLRAGADPTLRDSRGRSARDLALQRGHEKIAARL